MSKIIELGDETPPRWVALIEALALMSKGNANKFSPTHCEHDELLVMADPDLFTEEEIARLDGLGFFPDGDYFKSFEFGSA